METTNTLTKGLKNFLKPHILALGLSIMAAPAALADNQQNNLINELNSVTTSSKGLENKNSTKNIASFIKYLEKLQNKYEHLNLNDEKVILLLLRDVNMLVNVQIKYKDDVKLYGKTDYWASGIESITYGKGDCDDYALLKREILTSMGIDQEKLQLKYCKTKAGVSHLVLGYKIGDKDITLDNNSRGIYDNNETKRVKIIYSIDDNFVYAKGKKIGHNKGLKRFASYKDRVTDIDNRQELVTGINNIRNKKRA